MGKKRFAGTLHSDSHKTVASKFASDLDVWIRGWDYGIEVIARQVDGEDVFEVHTAGGSTGGRSNGHHLIGTLTSKGFVAA